MDCWLPEVTLNAAEYVLFDEIFGKTPETEQFTSEFLGGFAAGAAKKTMCYFFAPKMECFIRNDARGFSRIKSIK